MEIAAITLGLTGLVTRIFPLLGFPISGVDFILSGVSLAMGKGKKSVVITGLVLGAVGIVLNVVCMICGFIAMREYLNI